MSQYDVLNPTPAWEADIQDSMCPNYGFTRKRAATRSLMKAVGGIPFTRELGNTGHTLVLSWLSRSWACVQRLKQFYEQFEDGFFTIIDYDGGGRHYVGRFTTEVQPVETGNGTWDVQNVQFEEIPQSPMLEYPNNWAAEGIDVYPVNDFGDQKLAVNGDWTLAQVGAGAQQRWIATDSGVAGDWAQHEYRGYGFQLWCLVGQGQGIVQVFLDGTQVATVGLAGPAAAPEPQMVFSMTDVPLDLHRVQIVVIGAEFVPTGGGANEAIQTWGTGAAPGTFEFPSTPSGYTLSSLPCAWAKLRVMR